jgi:hypothetical protein
MVNFGFGLFLIDLDLCWVLSTFMRVTTVVSAGHVVPLSDWSIGIDTEVAAVTWVIVIAELSGVDVIN